MILYIANLCQLNNYSYYYVLVLLLFKKIVEKGENNMQDLRVKKTLLAIEKAFYELKETKQLEQIKVKNLCEKAMINKTTFYNYFTDVYALSDYLENKIIEEKFKILPRYSGALLNMKQMIYQVYNSFNCKEIITLFDNRYDVLIKKCEKKLFDEYKSTINTTKKQLYISFFIYGASHILFENKGTEEEKLEMLNDILNNYLYEKFGLDF